jgi:hypothetical protein
MNTCIFEINIQAKGGYQFGTGKKDKSCQDIKEICSRDGLPGFSPVDLPGYIPKTNNSNGYFEK